MVENQTNKTTIIAKNTLLLYIRMAIVMLVSLYTSRVILKVLGVEDFGIYNVVSGIVVMFSFLNTALTNASQRFLSFAIGKNDRREFLKVFSTSFYLHVLIALVVVALTETVGLWYVREKLSIPDGKESIAVLTYHLAVIATCINILRVPFQATVISFECMSVYAVISIIETMLKLLAVCILPSISGNTLLLYSLFIIIVYFIVFISFVIYCLYKYKVNLISVSDFGLIKDFVTFSGWNMLGGVADITYQQGTSLIINYFYGVTVNAAVGVMNQVRSAVYSFVINLQLAANPQIIKSYSRQEYGYFFFLISLISRLSYYLMLAIAIPLIINLDYVLLLWLKTVPEYSSEFCKLILIYCLIDSLSGPLWVSIQATGNMKYYQIFISALLTLNLPLSYFALQRGLGPSSVYFIQIIICILALAIRLILAHKYINLNITSYLKEVLFRVFLVTIICVMLTMMFADLCGGIWNLFLTFVVNLIVLLIAVYFVGIKNSERDRLLAVIFKK